MRRGKSGSEKTHVGIGDRHQFFRIVCVAKRGGNMQGRSHIGSGVEVIVRMYSLSGLSELHDMEVESIHARYCTVSVCWLPCSPPRRTDECAMTHVGTLLARHPDVKGVCGGSRDTHSA